MSKKELTKNHGSIANYDFPIYVEGIIKLKRILISLPTIILLISNIK